MKIFIGTSIDSFNTSIGTLWESVSADERGGAALTRATRTPHGSLHEAVQLLAQAAGIPL